MDFLSEVAPLLLLIVLNGVFSMSETAVVSARRARLQGLADAGANGARTALQLAQEPNRFLSTVQIAITLIGILAGAFGGTTVAHDLSVGLARVPAERHARQHVDDAAHRGRLAEHERFVRGTQA